MTKNFSVNCNDCVDTYNCQGFAILKLYNEQECSILDKFAKGWIYRLLSEWTKEKEESLLLDKYHTWSKTEGVKHEQIFAAQNRYLYPNNELEKLLINDKIKFFLRDIGMTKYMNMAGNTGKLTNEEYKEIQNHTKIGFELLQKVRDLPNSACHAVLEHHERINGSGYPSGLKGESIDQYAKIIGLADVFTSIIHDTPYRKKKLAIDAVKEILDIKDAFEYSLIKQLLKRIGIYPVGSFIQLNTNEIAQVVKLNYDVPLRPVVNIFPQEGSQTLKEVKVLDLSNQPSISIKSAKAI